MRNLRKAARLAGAAFRNGLRLHRDSILLFENGSYPSALQLSILAQEELGKAFLLEDYVFYAGTSGHKVSDDDLKLVMGDLVSHRSKQRRFARDADDITKYRGRRFPRFMTEATTGALDDQKQNATYVGLTRKAGKLDPAGKLIEPTRRVRRDYVEAHITRVNDHVIELAEGCRRGVYLVDTEEVDETLTPDLVSELEELWPRKSAGADRTLRRLRALSVEGD